MTRIQYSDIITPDDVSKMVTDNHAELIMNAALSKKSVHRLGVRDRHLSGYRWVTIVIDLPYVYEDFLENPTLRKQVEAELNEIITDRGWLSLTINPEEPHRDNTATAGKIIVELKTHTTQNTNTRRASNFSSLENLAAHALG